MFDRSNHPSGSVIERDEVKLTAGETPEARFKTWFDQVTAASRFCDKHRRTRLVLNEKESTFWPVYSHYGNAFEPKPGEFNFRVVYCCPACCCAYALCPLEFHETSFDTFDTSTPERAGTLARSREFAVQVNRHGCGFALFVGPTGPGKTRLACNIIGELNNREALYMRQGTLTAALRSTYGERPVKYDEDNRRVEPEHPLTITQGVRFLVLDEIGCTALANDERLLLDELLKHRYEQRKPTILISNLPLTGKPDQPGLKEFLGDAPTDRIRHAAGNGKFILQFTGESYRRTTGENYLEGLK